MRDAKMDFYFHESPPSPHGGSCLKEVSSEFLNSVLSGMSDETNSDFSPTPESEFFAGNGPTTSGYENTLTSHDEMEDILNQVSELTDWSNSSYSQSTDHELLQTSPPTAVEKLLEPKLEMTDEDFDAKIIEENFGQSFDVVVKSEQLPRSFLVCPICGNEAGKHIHYGGRACTSCRAFFRRSVQHTAYKKFYCSAKNCKIDSKSWRSCKWCRFQKCLASGLQPGTVNYDLHQQTIVISFVKVSFQLDATNTDFQ
jgi:hypothetical protein